jgi:hypothetical protein
MRDIVAQINRNGSFGRQQPPGGQIWDSELGDLAGVRQEAEQRVIHRVGPLRGT